MIHSATHCVVTISTAPLDLMQGGMSWVGYQPEGLG
jgi:hypothetical protein